MDFLDLELAGNGTGHVTVNNGTINAARLYTSKASLSGGSSLTIHDGGAVNINGYASTSHIDGAPAVGTLSDSLTIDGGSLTVSRHFNLGYFGETNLSLSGTGSISVAEELVLGFKSTASGIINMTGGFDQLCGFDSRFWDRNDWAGRRRIW